MPPPRVTAKLLGEEAECAFLWQAIRRGLVVSKPYGDSAPYDFIVDPGPLRGRPSRCLRIQVRSAFSCCRDCYTVRAGHGGQCEPLTRRHADFLVAFIVPVDAWYVIPIAALRGVRRAIAFRPHPNTRSRWERYREAWELLGASLESHFRS